MKRILACKKIVIILLTVTILSTVFYAYVLARPVSYGMSYHMEMEYENVTFEGTMRFFPDRTMVNLNSNLDNEVKSRYYYKNGYLFFTMALTDEAYEKEVASINDDFEKAVNSPFYAAKINAFKLVSKGVDDNTTPYVCTSAIRFAVAFGVVEVLLIALSVTCLILSKKAKCEE